MLAEALGRLLHDLGLTVVATTCDPEALLGQLADGAVDVLVLDAGFHPVSGPLVTLERIRAAAPGVRVVVVADAVDEALSVAARDGDLDGVVLASARGAELVAAVSPARSRSSARASARYWSSWRSGWTTTRSPRGCTSRATP